MKKAKGEHVARTPRKRPGVHSKNKNTRKRYRGQGRV